MRGLRLFVLVACATLAVVAASPSQAKTCKPTKTHRCVKPKKKTRPAPKPLPPLPPSSTASCSPTLAPNAIAAQNEASAPEPFFNEGPINPAGSLPATGHVDGVMLFVDFPDAPETGDPAALVSRHVSALSWFDRSSYGRFSVSITPVTHWYRMPRPATAYADTTQYPGHIQVMTDAIRAADADVDFSKYQFVYVVLADGWPQSGNPAFSAFPGYGVTVDGVEIRHGTILGPGDRANPAYVVVHETMHSLGLPDLYTFTPNGPSIDNVGGWDIMSNPRATDILGWQKWRLGWLDPSQLTCVDSGTVEETLTPLGVAGGKKLVVVQTSPSTAVVVEARARDGDDLSICRPGVLVYDVDSQKINAQGNIVVHPAPLGSAPGCGPPYPFLVGGVYEDSRVKVEVLATDGTDFRVRVTRK